MDKTVKILGIAGSLRRASYNKAALRVAQALVPAGVTPSTGPPGPMATAPGTASRWQ